MKISTFDFCFSYIISSQRSTEFIWIFQKDNSFYFENDGLSHSHINDRYVITSLLATLWFKPHFLTGQCDIHRNSIDSSKANAVSILGQHGI